MTGTFPQRLHAAYPIPAVKFGLIKPVCTEDLEVREEVITPLPDEFEKIGRKTRPKPQPSASPLWDVGKVVELAPDITKITVSISELRDKVKNISVNNN